jgi:hypothetical protein
MLAIGALLAVPLTSAAECAAPPVRNAEQAVCYALAYADKNGIQHARSMRKSVTRGAKVWTVRFTDTRKAERRGGWEVEVDSASGTIIRFMARKQK